MSKPKKKQTRARRGNRKAHFSLKEKSLTLCEKCQSPVMPHYACPVCGNYKGRSIFTKVYEKSVDKEEK